MNTRNLTDQQSALDLRVANLTKTLTAKYNAMDLLVGQMKATASNITSFFSSLERSEVREVISWNDKNPATLYRRAPGFCLLI